MSPNFDEKEFQRAADLQEIAIAQNVHAASGYRRLGEWWLEKFERTDDPADAEQLLKRWRAADDRLLE